MDKYTLKTAFKKSFLGMVWRIEADTATGMLAVETRQPDNGHPAFSAFRYGTGESTIQEIAYGDRHWTLAAIVADRLVVKAFGKDSPSHPGIACIDIHTGKTLWEQFNYTLLAVRDGLLLVRHRNFAGGYEQLLDPATGDLTKINISATKPGSPEIVLPERYADGLPEALASDTQRGDVFRTRMGEKTVWAFHEADNGNTYRLRLAVTGGREAVATAIVLNGLTKMVPETFFAIGNQLFLIGDNKREIVSYLV